VVLTLQLFFTYSGPMQRLFGVEAVSLLDWVRIVLVASSVLVLVEAEKYAFNQKGRAMDGLLGKW
jgi:hypothetical protein